jgi:hypothetical protein
MYRDEQQDTRFDTNGDDLIAVTNVRKQEVLRKQQVMKSDLIPVQPNPA